MSSFEFQYARLTAQSPGCDPNKVQGNRPEFASSFVAQMIGRIKPRRTYHAAYAYYCDDDRSMAELNLGMANWCWINILKRHTKTAYKALEVARVTELAVLMYLYPWQEEKRSARKCAAWVRVSPQTWEKKYSKQRDIIVQELAQMKSAADYQFHTIQREDEAELARFA